MFPTAEVRGPTSAEGFGANLPAGAGADSLTVRSRTSNTAYADADIVNITLLAGGSGASGDRAGDERRVARPPSPPSASVEVSGAILEAVRVGSRRRRTGHGCEPRHRDRPRR